MRPAQMARKGELKVRTDSGKRGETRSSALWGTGNRGGESRSNALWGKGGRGIVTALVAMLAISVPLASSAGKQNGLRARQIAPKRAWISPGLLHAAKKHPARLVHVIIQSTTGQTGAMQAFDKADKLDGFADREKINRRLGSIDAVAATIRLDKLGKLASRPNLIVTADVPVHVSAYSSNQLWPYESGVSQNWTGLGAPPTGPGAPTIAVVDSGIENRPDFGNRVLANVKLSTLPNDSLGDEEQLHPRSARQGGREALVRRRRRRRGGRQLRNHGGPERRALRTRQRPVRDHGRRNRHRRHGAPERRLHRSVVGLRPDAGRLHEARSGRSGPVHDRPRAGRLVARRRAAGQDLGSGLHPALRDVVRGAGDLGCGRADHRQAPNLHP